MHPLNFDLDFDGPLIPDQWPVFDAVLMCAFSPSSSSSPSVKDDPLLTPFPTAAELAAMPIPPSRSSPRNKDPGHIPRPRNAFMLFRSAFAAAQKISSSIEHDNRHITRVIAHCWNRLSEAEKQVWRDKAAVEKLQHAERYPNYRFSPVGRASKPVKRNVRRNGTEDVKRCEKLAELVMAGKFGRELEDAIKKVDDERLAAAHTIDDKQDAPTHMEMLTTRVDRDRGTRDAGTSDVPPFRSPLLPPATIIPAVPAKNLIPEPLTRTTTTRPDELATYSCTISGCSPESSSPTSCYQHYQPTVHDDVDSPESILPIDPYQSVMRFVHNKHPELEQATQDYSFFSWIQSDSFSYYH